MPEKIMLPKQYHRLHHLFFACISKELETPLVHPGQGALLSSLLDKGSMNQSELCRKLEVSAAAVAVSLRRLEQQGLLYREQNPNDLREKVLSLTPLGEKMALDLRKAIHKVEAHAMAGFTEEELDTLEGYLKRIMTSLLALKNANDTCASNEEGDECP